MNDRPEHVLICAPSNSAADAFIVYLKHYLTPKQLFRMFAFNRFVVSIATIYFDVFYVGTTNRKSATVPAEVLPFAFYRPEKQIFDIPPLEQLREYLVVVTTCATSSTLYSIGIGKQHFKVHLLFLTSIS